VLDLKADRAAVPPKDAATLILVRDASAGLEVFCVERNKKSGFLGGAIVFPGGKLDAKDADASLVDLVTAPRAPQRGVEPFAADAAHLRALTIAACRESLEEAAIVPLTSPASADDLSALRARLAAEPDALVAFLRARGAKLDLAALHPFARWITPEAEARRFDARFFVAIAPEGQTGAHDEHETMASFWARPAEVLLRFEAGEVQLAPPTHRTLALLAERKDASDVLALAEASCLDPICPRLVPQGDTAALTLPGDPEHEVASARVAGTSRYVLRAERWLPEDAPTP
jgi:8-oxo-dGTP pyrophosphatase MutT (NUDIX family)